MRKLYTLIAGLGIFTASTTFAVMQVTLIDNTSQYSYSNGGEFRAVANNPGLYDIVNWSAYATSTKGTITAATDGSSWGYNAGLVGSSYFQTFCIEYNEEFTPGVTYNVGVSQNAQYGSQPPSGDPISIGTAWLYSHFAAGSLAGYSYIYGSARDGAANAGALQQAIWWLEDEPNGVRNSFIDTAEAALGGLTDAQLKANSNGAFGVYALNLGAPGAVQDQLVIVVPEASTVIAGALLLLPFGASTLRILRKNRLA